MHTVIKRNDHEGYGAVVARLASLSKGKPLSPQQEAYREVFQATCEKFGVDNPFDLEDEQTKARFFKDVQLEWALKKGGIE